MSKKTSPPGVCLAVTLGRQVTLDNQGEALVLSFGASAHMDNAALIEKRLYSNLAMHKVQVP